MKWIDRKGWKTAICSSLLLRLGFLVLLTIGITSCWYPLFNLDVAVGEQLVGKLGAPILVMQGEFQQFGPGDLRDAFFVPRRNPPNQMSGFLVQENQFGRQIAEVFFWEQDKRFQVANSQNFPTGPKNGNLNQYVTDYGNAGIGFVIQDFENMSGQMWFRDPFNPEDILPEQIPPFPNATDPRVAVSFVQNRFNLDSEEDNVMILDWMPTIPTSLSLNYMSVTSYSTTLTPTFLNLDFLDPYTTYGKPSFGFVGFSHISDSFFFSTRVEDGSQKFFIWDGPMLSESPPSLLPIPQQVTGILSNGNYLAQEDNSITLYSPTGSFLYRIYLGNIRFNFERYDIVDDTWYSVFSRVLHGDYELRIEVFEIKTSEFRKLATP